MYVCMYVCTRLFVSVKVYWGDLDEKNSVSDWTLQVGDFIERTCPACAPSHKTIVYKRLTDPGTIDFKNLFSNQVGRQVENFLI